MGIDAIGKVKFRHGNFRTTMKCTWEPYGGGMVWKVLCTSLMDGTTGTLTYPDKYAALHGVYEIFRRSVYGWIYVNNGRSTATRKP